MTSKAKFLQAYSTIQNTYKEVIELMEKGISYEAGDQLMEAVKTYKRILELIEVIFTIPVGLPNDIDDIQLEWNDACALILKLKSMKTEATGRLDGLRILLQSIDENTIGIESAANRKSLFMENSKAFSDATVAPKTYKEISMGLREIIANKNATVQFDTLFQAEVKLYRIEAGGSVITLSRGTSMSLVMCTVGSKWKYLNGIYFIQCAIPGQDLISGDDAAAVASTVPESNMIWIYPLIPTITNCYRTDYGAFIFPDMESSVQGNAFGLILIKSQKLQINNIDVDEDEQLVELHQFFLDLLEAVLKSTVKDLMILQTQGVTSQQVSETIVSAANFVACNLIKGAEKTGSLIIKSTPYIITKIKPAADDGPTVPSSVQTSVKVAQKVTQIAAGITGWVAGKVGLASVSIGSYLAPHIQTQGSCLLQKGFGYDSAEANSKMKGGMTIAAGAIEGFQIVVDGLESAAKILGCSLSENSVKIIEHKYGNSAGNLSAGISNTIGNAFTVSRNVNYITPKGVAAKMIKKTGEAVILDYKQTVNRNESHYIAASALHPDLRCSKDTKML